MKKKILGMTVIAMIAIVASYNVYILQEDVKLSGLLLSNVEALADNSESGQPEQPSVKDCITDDESSCIALHPTDSSKDDERPNAVWP